MFMVCALRVAKDLAVWCGSNWSRAPAASLYSVSRSPASSRQQLFLLGPIRGSLSYRLINRYLATPNRHWPTIIAILNDKRPLKTLICIWTYGLQWVCQTVFHSNLELTALCIPRTGQQALHLPVSTGVTDTALHSGV